MEPSKHLHQAFAELCRNDLNMTKYFWLGVQVVSDNAPSSRLPTRLNDYVFRNSISAFYRCIPVESDHDLFCLEEKAVTNLEQSLLHLTTTAFQGVHFCLFGAKMTTVKVARLKMGLSAFNLLVELNPDGEYIRADVIAHLADSGRLKSWIDDYLRRPGALYSLIEEQ